MDNRFAAVVLATTFICVSANAQSVDDFLAEFAARETGASTIDFSFTRPNRYGLDRNSDGYIDIPNSSDYVLGYDDCPGPAPNFPVLLSADRPGTVVPHGISSDLLAAVITEYEDVRHSHHSSRTRQPGRSGGPTTDSLEHLPRGVTDVARDIPLLLSLTGSNRFRICLAEGTYRIRAEVVIGGATVAGVTAEQKDTELPYRAIGRQLRLG